MALSIRTNPQIVPNNQTNKMDSNVATVKNAMSMFKATLSMYGGNIIDVMLDVARMPPPFKSCVRVGPSPGRGKGVFTTRAVKAGEVITLHPCHVMVKDGNTICHKERAEHLHQNMYMLNEYKFTFNPNLEILADPDAPFCAHACGHMINDPHPNVDSLRNPPPTPEQAWKMAMEYKIRTDSQANCVFEAVDDFVVLCVASRDIAEGEEVFVRYGICFWNEMATSDLLALIGTHSTWLKEHKPQQFDATADIFKGCYKNKH